MNLSTAFEINNDGVLAYSYVKDKKTRVDVGGQDVAELDNVGTIVLAPTGKRVAFPVRVSKNVNSIWADGTLQGSYEHVSTPAFSPDGKHVVYFGWPSKKKTGNLVVNGKEVQHTKPLIALCARTSRRRPWPMLDSFLIQYRPAVQFQNESVMEALGVLENREIVYVRMELKGR
jgi:hypothetical protein